MVWKGCSAGRLFEDPYDGCPKLNDNRNPLLVRFGIIPFKPKTTTSTPWGLQERHARLVWHWQSRLALVRVEQKLIIPTMAKAGIHSDNSNCAFEFYFYFFTLSLNSRPPMWLPFRGLGVDVCRQPSLCIFRSFL